MSNIGVTDGARGSVFVSNIAGGDGLYTRVELMNEATGALDSDLVDTTIFGNTWGVSQQATQSFKVTGGGFFDYYNDATGQTHIMNNAVTGAETWIWLLYTCSTGVKAQILVTDFTISTKPQGMVEFKFSAESTGTITDF